MKKKHVKPVFQAIEMNATNDKFFVASGGESENPSGGTCTQNRGNCVAMDLPSW